MIEVDRYSAIALTITRFPADNFGFDYWYLITILLARIIHEGDFEAPFEAVLKVYLEVREPE